MTRYFCLRWGGWMLRNWHLYHWTPHQDVKHGKNKWYDWDQVL
jgi:hypothetical protein